jgi:DNA-binding SARP family transcriptional activator
VTGPARIQLCGELRVRLGGLRREDALRGRQGRMLLAYLVLHRARPVRRDELVEALWPDDDRPPSETALAPVLSRLRRAVEPTRIEGRETLRLVLPEPAWVDIEIAGEGVEAARAALRDGNAAAAARDAREAAALLAPGLLPGLDAAWLDTARAALDELRVEALEIAAQAGLRLGGDALPEAERAARGAVAAAPFRESARATLVAVLERRGNTAEAIRAYEEIRVLLREELGTVPGPELVALHERLIGLGSHPASPAPGAPAESGLHEHLIGLGSHAASPAPPGAPADLVERERELAEIAAALARLDGGQGGAIVFEGAAGIGKTRLLAELGERAPAHRARVLQARAGVMERDFGFGVVRQLLAGVAAGPALAGAAAPARAALGDSAELGAGEGSFAILDALFAVTAEQAAAGPLVLSIDDLQWSDPASLRFVAYLTRRVSSLPVLIAATVRTGEPGADELLLGEIAQDPSSVALRPAPLTHAATVSLVRARLGENADDAFVGACREVTAGNPLLLRQLLTALVA